MQAAANRSAALKSASPAASNDGPGIRASADDSALLDALPIAAGVFGLRKKKLWVHALNSRFTTLFGCEPGPSGFSESFDRHKDSTTGDFVRTYLANPAKAADELDYAEGEGPTKRFLKLKVAPLEPCSQGAPRCLLS